MALSLDTAMAIVRAAVAEAAAAQAAVDIAVVDAGGRLIAFNRMEGAEPAGIFGAPGKASLSTAFAAPSGELREATEQPWARGLLGRAWYYRSPQGSPPNKCEDDTLGGGSCGPMRTRLLRAEAPVPGPAWLPLLPKHVAALGGGSGTR